MGGNRRKVESEKTRKVGMRKGEQYITHLQCFPEAHAVGEDGSSGPCLSLPEHLQFLHTGVIEEPDALPLMRLDGLHQTLSHLDHCLHHTTQSVGNETLRFGTEITFAE